MLVGYELLKDCNNEELLNSLSLAGCQKIYTDPENVAKGGRTGLKQALDLVGSGDVLVVRRLDRLGKTVWLILKIIHQLIVKGAQLRSLEENFSISTSSTVIELVEILISFEQKGIELRTLSRKTTGQKNGKKIGRPPITEEVRELVEMFTTEMTVQETCNYLKISRATYYNYFPQKKKK